jgi:hypothetical protein
MQTTPVTPLTNPAAVYHSDSQYNAKGLEYIIHDAHDNLVQCFPVTWGSLIEKPHTTGTSGKETIYHPHVGETLERWGVDADIVDTIQEDINSWIEHSVHQQQEFNARLLTYLPKECDDGVPMCLSTLFIIALPRVNTEATTIELGYAFMQTGAEMKHLPGSLHEVAAVQCALRYFQAEWIRTTMPSAVQTWNLLEPVRDTWPMKEEYYAYEHIDEDPEE